jgi:hypothetical protein
MFSAIKNSFFFFLGKVFKVFSFGVCLSRGLSNLILQAINCVNQGHFKHAFAEQTVEFFIANHSSVLKLAWPS